MSDIAVKRWSLSLEDRFRQRRTVTLDRFPFSIGRATSNELQLDHMSVSRRHARVDRDGDKLVVEDLGSRNRVLLNGAQVEKSRLHHGDQLTIGVFRLDVKEGGAPDPAAFEAESNEATQTRFFDPKMSWDPLGAFTSALSQFESVSKSAAMGPDWRQLLQLALVDHRPQANERILRMTSECMACARALLILFDQGLPERAEIAASHIVGRDPSSRRRSEIFVSTEILRRVAETREAAIVSSDETPDIEARESFIQSGAASAACLPLLAGESVLGVLYVDTAAGQPPITRDSIQALFPVAGLLALKTENRRLQDAQLHEELDRKELDIARSVQEGLYPKETAQLAHYSIDGFTRACYQVGGDFFDFYPHTDAGLTWLVGDVSGKGLSAALYSVSALSTLRAHLRDGLQLADLVRKLEVHVRENFRSDYFLTFLMGKLDPATGEFRYCNAGHMPPVVFKTDGAVVELDCEDPALNVLPWQDFTVSKYQLEKGDLLLAFTDGLFECEGEEGGRYGLEEAIEFIRAHRHLEPAEIRREILLELERYSGPRGLNDDITLLLVRRE